MPIVVLESRRCDVSVEEIRSSGDGYRDGMVRLLRRAALLLAALFGVAIIWARPRRMGCEEAIGAPCDPYFIRSTWALIVAWGLAAALVGTLVALIVFLLRDWRRPHPR
jgi:hypothetical protein